MGSSMARVHYYVTPRAEGWTYRLERTHSPVFGTRQAAIAAAKETALKMHELGDDTQVLVQADDGAWITVLDVDRFQSSA